MKEAIIDVLEGIKKKDIWLHFALSDTRARYSRSIIGPWWITLGTAIGVIGLGVVWSAVMKISISVMLPNLAVGLVVWNFLSGVISESSNCLVNQAPIIRNYTHPLSIHIYRLLSKHLITFSHNLLIIIVVFSIYGFPSTQNTIYAFLGIFILVINLCWISLLIALLGARFRDLGPSIDALMPILFFLTPILYKKTDLEGFTTLININPLALLFGLIKDPLLSIPFDSYNYLASLLLAAGGWGMALFALQRLKKLVVFWI